MASLAELLARVRDLRRSARDEQEFLRDAADMDSGRLTAYERAERYYDGDHRVQLTAREREYLQRSGIPYAENFCETIVDTHAARLTVRTFGSDNEDTASFADDVWDASCMDAGQLKVHEGAIKLGDYFVIIEPGDETTLPQLCPNRPNQVKAVYDSGEMLYAVKVWSTARASTSNPQGRAIRRMNIYWPDSIEKWWTPSADDEMWGAFRETDTTEGNVEFWTMDGTPDGEAIGIPVIHFANKPNPHYGRPHHWGSIPQQDALNKSLIDHFWVMDAQGWPQQFGTGVSASDVKRHPGSLWTTEKDGASFGQLAPADPEKSILAIESQIKRMASRSNTPLHLMLAGGNLPSGETLKTSESGLSRQSGRRQVEWGEQWEAGLRIAARAEVAFGANSPPLDAKLDAQWERAESRQEVDEANTAVLWQTLGVSQDTILSRLGFDPVEEREKRSRDGSGDLGQQMLDRAAQMQAPTSSEAAGGGRQPGQLPANARVTT